jgi:hypothetical protein
MRRERRLSLQGLVWGPLKRPDGSVAVMRVHIEQLFGFTSETRKRQPIEPNWGALNATRTEA